MEALLWPGQHEVVMAILCICAVSTFQTPFASECSATELLSLEVNFISSRSLVKSLSFVLLTSIVTGTKID